MAAASDAWAVGIHECPCDTGTVVSNIQFWRPKVSALGIVIACQSMITAVPRRTAMYCMLPGLMGQINEEGIICLSGKNQRGGQWVKKTRMALIVKGWRNFREYGTLS